jgi:hypothetical protein
MGYKRQTGDDADEKYDASESLSQAIIIQLIKSADASRKSITVESLNGYHSTSFTGQNAFLIYVENIKCCKTFIRGEL